MGFPDHVNSRPIFFVINLRGVSLHYSFETAGIYLKVQCTTRGYTTSTKEGRRKKGAGGFIAAHNSPSFSRDIHSV